MLARCQASKVRSYLAARVCTLAPDSADAPELPGRLSQGELQRSKYEYWSLTEQAALPLGLLLAYHPVQAFKLEWLKLSGNASRLFCWHRLDWWNLF